MSADDIRRLTQSTWDQFYTLGSIWARSMFLQSLRSRVAFTLISELYRQMTREHRDRHPQCSRESVNTVGTLARAAMPAPVREGGESRFGDGDE
jgi:hypothetical protein